MCSEGDSAQTCLQAEKKPELRIKISKNISLLIHVSWKQVRQLFYVIISAA